MSGSRRDRLNIVVAQDALHDLEEIGRWNIERYGRDHATRYVRKLFSTLNRLDRDFERSRVVEARPAYRYLRLGKDQRRHGHLAVFRVVRSTLTVLRIFHTAQDWQNLLP